MSLGGTQRERATGGGAHFPQRTASATAHFMRLGLHPEFPLLFAFLLTANGILWVLSVSIFLLGERQRGGENESGRDTERESDSMRSSLQALRC